MPQNFLPCDRDQELLLPLSLRDWLPADRLAWFVTEIVDELDLEPFCAAYRLDRHGRAALEPSMMVSLLVYAYAVGVRSARQIERVLPGGCGVSGDHGEPDARSRDDREVPRPA
jgi:transposase